MNWKQAQAFSEHRTQRIISGNVLSKDHKSNIHSPRNSQHSHKDTFVGLQRISKEIVESLTKALTPNCRVRQNSPKHNIQIQEQKTIQKPISQHENFRQPLESLDNTKLNKEQTNVGYINFTKFARKISQQPLKDVKFTKIEKKMSRQKSEDFHSKQEEWLKQKNEKVLKKRLEQQCQQQKKENRISFLDKSQTDRFQ